MSKKVIVISFFLAITSCFGVSHLASAEAQSQLSEAKLAQVRNTCVEAQSSLQQIRSSDTLLRVNQGQRYEQMSTKLMAPMNSRIALNRFDGNTLLSTTAEYEKQLRSFRDAFRLYDNSLSAAIGQDCRDEPQKFYDQVVDAREKRHVLHKKIVLLNDLLKRYRQQFSKFASKLEEQQQ